MTDEEKKAIEYIKEFKNEVFEGVGNKSTMAKNIDILLNLIKKQQKEIEREKQYTDFYKDLCNKQQKLINQLLEDMKERANNFSYESEIMWRKIEKAEKLLEEE